MHEASIAWEIYGIVEENAKLYNLKVISSIFLKIGDFNGIDEESLKFAFKALSYGTNCENAEILIEPGQGFDLIVQRIEGEEGEEYEKYSNRTENIKI